MSFDKSKIKPIPIQKTLVLLNNFIANTADFFNAFSETVEKKLSSVSNKVTELETLLAVLEAKLNSIPDLDHSEPVVYTSCSLPVQSNVEVPVAASAEASTRVASSAQVAPSMESAVDSSKVVVSEHPNYLPFFKLLKVGVPSFVVQAKVSAAGLDPSMIDTPDRMVDL
jgi:hypothetical protein